MIVFRTTTAEEEKIQINFCDSGLYIQIGEDNAEVYAMKNAVISSKEEIKCLIDYLNSEYARLD
jgi:hypothetical protein